MGNRNSADGSQNLIKLCENGVIDKIRYEVKAGNHTFEVDEFLAIMKVSWLQK